MPIRDFGAVCDTSVLTDRDSIDEARKMFNSSGLYIPSPTYSWLSRAKLIRVRKQTVKYSLLSQMVREREIYPIQLPELYDEIGRQVMFETNRNVALTDIRGLLLSAHLQIPILTFDDGLLDRITEEIGIQRIGNFEAHANWLSIRDALELYRELLFDSGRKFHEQLKNGGTFPKTVRKIKETQEDNLKTTEESVKKVSQGQTNPGTLEFQYLAWDIIPSIREYHEQRIVQPDTARQVCERSVLLMAKPIDFGDSD